MTDRTKTAPTPKQPKRPQATGDPWWVTVGRLSTYVKASSEITPRKLRKGGRPSPMDKALIERAAAKRIVRRLRRAAGSKSYLGRYYAEFVRELAALARGRK